MSRFLDKVATGLAGLGCGLVISLVGCGLMAWSVAYWLGTNREADRFITSYGRGGFVVSYIVPVVALIPLMVCPKLIIEGKAHWFFKGILLLLYGALCVSLITFFARRGLVW